MAGTGGKASRGMLVDALRTCVVRRSSPTQLAAPLGSLAGVPLRVGCGARFREKAHVVTLVDRPTGLTLAAPFAMACQPAAASASGRATD